MRRLVLLLFVACLPLRGWVGDAMATEMLLGVPADVHATAMAPDCPMHMADAASSSQADVPAESETCSSCVLCLPYAALDVARIAADAFAHESAPGHRETPIVSAVPHQAFKPPIS